MFATAFKRLLHRPLDSHKFLFGYVLVVGGSRGMTGAAVLSAHAALRTGAGLVTVASEDEPAAIARLDPEIMTTEISDVESLAAFVQKRTVSVVAIGSGLKPSPKVLEYLRWLIIQPELVVIIDGGALTSLADELSLLDSRTCKSLILTPHPGEFNRLQPQGDAQVFVDTHKVICVLKGHETKVLDMDREGYTNHTGNPGLATAGSGDVLTGIIAGMVAQGLEPLLAAQCATYFHGLCGDIATTKLTQPAVNASDIIAAIPEAYKQC